MEGVLSTNDDGDLDYTPYDEDRGCYPLADVTRERPPEADQGSWSRLRPDGRVHQSAGEMRVLAFRNLKH